MGLERARVADIGAVAIGRNEGERLVRCLGSLVGKTRAIVYVDSGSTDDSVAAARARGAEVVELDTSQPFTAARARNAGFARLSEILPDVDYVQFVDGDCEVDPGWLAVAAGHLDRNESLAVVCGRRRERHPEASPYNRIIDIEWNSPIGEARSCGGDAMMRASVFRAVGGYDPSLIAGEEPELCLRIRRAGHRIVRLDHEMTLHDAALDRFAQFWRRSQRSGHAYAELAAMHGAAPPHFAVREVFSILAWGSGPALLVLGSAVLGGRWTAAAPLLLYGVLWWRVRRGTRKRGYGGRDASLYALACVVGKLAEFTGVVRYAWNRLVLRRRTRLIEYKAVP